MAETILEMENVIAGYGDTQILHNLSLDIARGERLAIIGRNGVGKTTTLATIMGLTRQYAGSVRLYGEPISHLPPHRRSRLGLGLVPQTRDIFPSLTVEENLRAGIRKDANIDEAYELFPRLKERRSNGGRQLSGGEQQMLAIARTLMGKPEIILLDEPLEGLAPVICERLIEVFHELSTRGQTVVLVEQHTALALQFADRVLIVEQGAIVLKASAAELAENREILDRHVGIGLSD